MWKPSDKLIEFCTSPQARKGCFGRWPASSVAEYLQHHELQQTLHVTWDVADGIAVPLAVGTGAQCDLEDFANPFLIDHPDGKCLFLETLIVSKPGCFFGLVSTMLFRWPHWRSLQIIGRRNGRIVKYDTRIIERFTQYGWRHLAREHARSFKGGHPNSDCGAIPVPC